jgi:hypothetical protein
MVPDDAANAALKASQGGLVMNFIRYAAICGHLVEEFRWLGQPTCFVDGHQVSGSFDRAVADLQVAGRAPPGNRIRNTSRWIGGNTLTPAPLAAQNRKENPIFQNGRDTDDVFISHEYPTGLTPASIS